MNNEVRCQSCGMPLGKGVYGTNWDKSENKKFCKFCFQGGDFTEPNLTLPQMIEKSVRYMVQNLSYSKEDALALSRKIISELRRWKKS